MNILTLDFETYYDNEYTLKKLSIPEYVHDPRFHVHGLAIRWPDGRKEFRADVAVALHELRSQFGATLENVTVLCHNAAFDLYVLNHTYGIKPIYFTDTMLLAYHVHGRREKGNGEAASLSALADRYGLGPKGNLDFMSGVREPNAFQFADLAIYAQQDVEITYQLVERLLPEITRPEVELLILMHTVLLVTERAIRVDAAGIAPLEEQIRQDKEQFLKSAGVTPEAISKDTIFAPLLATALARTGRSLPMKQGKHKLIPATARTDQEMQALADDDDPAVAALASARLSKKAEDQRLARLDTLRHIAAATGGWLPPHLVYYGARTGRFAGGGGFNIQNLGRSGPASGVRRLLLPRSGRVFVIADLAQIEARIVAWLAGEVGLVEAFRDGREIYSEFATTTLGREVRKPTDGDADDVKEELEALRQVGKQAVLGLGFGMGALKFMNRLRATPKLAPLFRSGLLTPLICRDIVQTFRRGYPCIPRFWEELDAALHSSIDGLESQVGRIRVDRCNDLTRVWLPSGRALRYPNLRLSDEPRTIKYLDLDGMEAEFMPDGPSLTYGANTSIYGGMLCENVAQATARDLLVEAILRLEKRDLPILFHCHDEVVVEAVETQSEHAMQGVAAEMTRVPQWAEGLPVGCAVRSSCSYSK